MPSPRIIVSAFKAFRQVLPLMRDERVPVGLKAGAGVMALLIVSPLDIFADIPILGVLDDAVLLTLLAMLFVALASRMSTAQGPAPKNVTPKRPPLSS